MFNSEKKIQEWINSATCGESRLVTDWDCLDFGNTIVELVYHSKNDCYGILNFYIPNSCRMNDNTCYHELEKWSDFFNQNPFLKELFGSAIKNSIRWIQPREIIDWMQSREGRDAVLKWDSDEASEWWDDCINEAKSILALTD